MRLFLQLVNTTLLSTSLFNVKYEQNMRNLHNCNPPEVLNLMYVKCDVMRLTFYHLILLSFSGYHNAIETLSIIHFIKHGDWDATITS